MSRSLTAWVISDPVRGIVKVTGRRVDGWKATLNYEDPDTGVEHIAREGEWFLDEAEARGAVLQRVQRTMVELRDELMKLSGVLNRIEAREYPVVDLTKNRAG